MLDSRGRQLASFCVLDEERRFELFQLSARRVLWIERTSAAASSRLSQTQNRWRAASTPAARRGGRRAAPRR